MAPDPPAVLYELPPSAKLVFVVLQEQDRLTQKGLAAHTRLSERTVRHALDELRSIGALQEDVYFADARQRVYSIDLDGVETTDST